MSNTHSIFNLKGDINTSILTEKAEFETTKKQLGLDFSETKRVFGVSKTPRNPIYKSKPKQKLQTITPQKDSHFELIYEGCDTLPVRAVAFSKSGQNLIVGSNSGVLNLYSLKNIVKNYSMKGNENFDPNNYTRNLRNILHSCDEFKQDAVYSVKSSRSTGLIAAGSVKGKVKIFKINSEDDDHMCELGCVRSLKKSKGRIRNVDFSYDSQRLISSGQDRKIFCFDVETGKNLAEYSSAFNHVNIFYIQNLFNLFF